MSRSLSRTLRGRGKSSWIPAPWAREVGKKTPHQHTMNGGRVSFFDISAVTGLDRPTCPARMMTRGNSRSVYASEGCEKSNACDQEGLIMKVCRSELVLESTSELGGGEGITDYCSDSATSAFGPFCNKSSAQLQKRSGSFFFFFSLSFRRDAGSAPLK